MPTPRGHGRRHLRVPLHGDARVAWGYRQGRCTITEFSPAGVTAEGLDAPVGTTVSLELALPDGRFTVCGVVVHRQGKDGAVGIRFVGLTPTLTLDLELFLWDLILGAAAPADESTCSIVGCGRPRKARGLCGLHYSRWRRERSRDGIA